MVRKQPRAKAKRQSKVRNERQLWRTNNNESVIQEQPCISSTTPSAENNRPFMFIPHHVANATDLIKIFLKDFMYFNLYVI